MKRLVSFLALTLIAFSAMACQVNPVTGKSELNIYSRAEEKAMGDQAAPQILAELGGEYPDPELKAYVTRVGNKVVNSGRTYIQSQGRDFPDWDFQFYVVNDSMVNAFALPGGHVFVTRGILTHMKDEAELAGLLGHECAHVFLSHSAVQQSTQLFTSLGVAALGVALEEDSAWIASLAGMAANLHGLSHSRDHESASDQWGMEFMVGSQYHADGMIGVMEMLQEASHGSEQPEFLSTHPNPANRIAKLTELRDTKYPNATAERGFIVGKEAFTGTVISGFKKTEDAYDFVDKGDAEVSAAAKAIEAGKKGVASQHLARATSLYNQAIQKVPTHGLVHRKLGHAQMLLGDRGAVNSLARARSLQGADFFEDYLYAIANENTGNHAVAASAHESSLRKVPGYLPAMAGAARSFEQSGNQPRAKAYYEAIAQNAPQNSEIQKAALAKVQALTPAPK